MGLCPRLCLVFICCDSSRFQFRSRPHVARVDAHDGEREDGDTDDGLQRHEGDLLGVTRGEEARGEERDDGREGAPAERAVEAEVGEQDFLLLTGAILIDLGELREDGGVHGGLHAREEEVAHEEHDGDHGGGALEGDEEGEGVVGGEGKEDDGARVRRHVDEVGEEGGAQHDDEAAEAHDGADEGRGEAYQGLEDERDEQLCVLRAEVEEVPCLEKGQLEGHGGRSSAAVLCQVDDHRVGARIGLHRFGCVESKDVFKGHTE